MAAASIVFVDIVGFSTKSTSAQREIIDSFNKELRTFLAQFFNPFTGESEVIALPTGDGVCLSFLHDNDDRKWNEKTIFEINIQLHKWAYEISSPDNIVELRIGVHMGVVDIVLDLNNKKNVVGDTINFASRVMSAAKACQTLISDTVYNQYIGIATKRMKLLFQGNEMSVVFKGPVKIFAKHDRELTLYEMLLDPMVPYLYNGESKDRADQAVAMAAQAVNREIEPEMVLIQGGIFDMGSQKGNATEKPVHKVEISSFEMSKFIITQKQWRAVMGNNPSKNKDKDNCPVERVSFTDVQEYLKKLNEKTGKNYRLPTEAEWEFAARGGTLSKGYTYAGSNDIKSVAWDADNSGGVPHPVGGKQPNELGLFDMTGNVWEWCNDFYDEHYYKNSPVKDPKGPEFGDNYVIRGGSWINYPARYQVWDRFYNYPNDTRNYLGFRVARSI